MHVRTRIAGMAALLALLGVVVATTEFAAEHPAPATAARPSSSTSGASPVPASPVPPPRSPAPEHADKAELVVASPQVFFVGNTIECDWAQSRCKELGIRIACCGNGAFDRWIPTKPGFTLIVASLAGTTRLSAEYAHLLPTEELASAASSRHSGVVTRKLPGGTVVYVVFGTDPQALESELMRFSPSE